MAGEPQEAAELEVSLLEKEKQTVIKGIRKLKLRVSPPELAAQTNLSINKASYWLNKIAGETHGQLEVAAEGTIYYKFAGNFTDAYLKRGVFKALLVIGSVLFQVLYWIVRMSFGVALILSLLVIAIICLALILMALSATNSDSDGGFDLGSVAGGIFNLDFLFDIFSFGWTPNTTYYPNTYSSRTNDAYSEYLSGGKKSNFFVECFSFLFGDGPPNANLDEIRWQRIARLIKANGGVVSTEQLSPWLDGDRSDSGMILTALAQFNGRPEVTKSGYIVYIFPDFLGPVSSDRGQGDGFEPRLITASEATRRRFEEFDTAPYLKEDHWRFSGYPAETQFKVLCLALLNFAGSWWLFKHIATIHMLTYLSLLVDFLLAYAAVFLLIPLVRFAVISVLNTRIDARNTTREIAYELIKDPKGDVLEELEEAAVVRQQELIGTNLDRRVIYTTEKDDLEQRFES